MVFRGNTFDYRSPPRTRRSSSSSVGSNSGGLAPSTPPAITRNRSHSPSQPQQQALGARHANLSPAPGRRSRSPTPRRTLTPTPTTRNRSRSPTPNYRLTPGSRNRSPSPTPRRELAPTVASRNRSRSPTPRKELKSSRPSTPSARRSRSTSPKEGVNAAKSWLEDNYLEGESAKAVVTHHNQQTSAPLEDFGLVETTSTQVCNGCENDQEREVQDVWSSDDVMAQTMMPSNRAVATLITDDLLKATLEDKKLDVNQIVTETSSTVKNKVEDISPGVDCSPCSRVSDNFINHPVRGSSGSIGSVDSPRHREYESGVDTSPAQRVSDNFTSQHRVSVSIRRSPTPVKEVKSGVDSTPSRRISENFIAGDSRRGSAKYASANGLDTLGSTDGHTNNDSGSEVSDEGYRSLGVVQAVTATAANAPGAKSLTGKLKKLG